MILTLASLSTLALPLFESISPFVAILAMASPCFSVLAIGWGFFVLAFPLLLLDDLLNIGLLVVAGSGRGTSVVMGASVVSGGGASVVVEGITAGQKSGDAGVSSPCSDGMG